MRSEIFDMSLSPNAQFEGEVTAAREIDIRGDGPNVVLLQEAIAYLSKTERGKEAVKPPGSEALIEALRRDPSWRREVVDAVFPILDSELSFQERFANQVREARRINIHDTVNRAALLNALHYLRQIEGAQTDYHPQIPKAVQPLIAALQQDEEWKREVEKAVKKEAFG